MLSLIVITGHKFYAVAFPMRARVQSRRTCIILLLLIWVLPIVISSPMLIFFDFNLKYHSCHMILSTHHIRIWHTIRTSFLFFVPLLVMLVLYPVITVKLRQQKIPGNANCPQAVIKRKHNFRLTTMFLTITVAFIICWGMNHITLLVYLFSLTDECTFPNVHNVVNVFTLVFHAINPVIYFTFCPSYRQGIKQLLSCCFRRVHEQHSPGSNQIELDSIPRAWPQP